MVSERGPERSVTLTSPEAVAAEPDSRNTARSSSRLPFFTPSTNPKIPLAFKTICRIPAIYHLAQSHRHYVLGWPAPLREVVDPLLKRYRKKDNIQSFRNGYT